MKNLSIAQLLKYDGDKIAQLFFDELTDANFHTEVKFLHAVYEAIQWTPETSNKQQLKDNVIAAIKNIEV